MKKIFVAFCLICSSGCMTNGLDNVSTPSKSASPTTQTSDASAPPTVPLATPTPSPSPTPTPTPTPTPSPTPTPTPTPTPPPGGANAVITQPGDTMHLAGLTIEQWSCFDSTPSSTGKDIVGCAWNFGDGTTEIGFHVSHQYANAGTYTVILTVGDDTGATGTAVTFVTVTTPNYVWTRYVAANGLDTNPGTQASPYKTFGKAVDDWNNNLPPAGLGHILVNRGDMVAWNSDGPRTGPIVMESYGSGADPTLSVNAGSEVYMSENHAPHAFGNSIYFNHLNISWTARDPNNNLTLSLRGSQFTNCNLINGTFTIQDIGNYGISKVALWHSSSTAGWRLGVYGSLRWLLLESSVFKGAGHDIDYDHQAYINMATQYTGIINNVFDGTGANAVDSGLKYNGVYYGDIRGNEIMFTRQGIDGGSNEPVNGGQQNIKARITGNYIHDIKDPVGCYQPGISMSWVKDYVIANNIFANNNKTCESGAIDITGNTSSHLVEDVRVFNNTIVNWSSNCLAIGNANWQNVKFENNICYKRSTDSDQFIEFIGYYTPDLTTLTMNNNLFYKVGENSSSAGFAWDGRASVSFDDWVKNHGKDGASLYADPLFVSSSDVHLQSTSPAIDQGLTIPLVWGDKDQILRPQGNGYDIGAFEHQ